MTVTFAVVGEYVGAAAAVAAIVILHACGKLPRPLFPLFWTGVGLAAVWEFCHELVPGTIQRRADLNRHVPGPVYAILHAVYDGLLFLVATAVTLGVARAIHGKRQARVALGKPNPVLLFVLVCYAVAQAILFERLFNGRWWTYAVSSRNPVIIPPNVTRLPVAEWAIAIGAYYVVQTACYAKVAES